MEKNWGDTPSATLTVKRDICDCVRCMVVHYSYHFFLVSSLYKCKIVTLPRIILMLNRKRNNVAKVRNS